MGAALLSLCRKECEGVVRLMRELVGEGGQRIGAKVVGGGRYIRLRKLEFIGINRKQSEQIGKLLGTDS